MLLFRGKRDWESTNRMLQTALFKKIRGDLRILNKLNFVFLSLMLLELGSICLFLKPFFTDEKD